MSCILNWIKQTNIGHAAKVGILESYQLSERKKHSGKYPQWWVQNSVIFLGNQVYGDENPRTQWRFIAGDIDSIDGETQHFLIVRTDYSTSFTSGWWYTYPS